MDFELPKRSVHKAQDAKLRRGVHALYHAVDLVKADGWNKDQTLGATAKTQSDMQFQIRH